MKDIMLDLETLGTRHDAMIISIGAVYFDRYTGEIGLAFSANINPVGFADKFSMDYDTIKWWMEQSDNARKLVMEAPFEIREALAGFSAFVGDGSDKLIWSHATFDMPIIQNAFDVFGIKFPIPFRNARDLRTLMDLTDHHTKLEREGVHHHALDDAKYQAKYAAEAMYKLKYGG